MNEIENRFEILDFENAQEEKERRARQKKEREKRLQEIEDRGECEGLFGPYDNKDLSWLPDGSAHSRDRPS